MKESKETRPVFIVAEPTPGTYTLTVISKNGTTPYHSHAHTFNREELISRIGWMRGYDCGSKPANIILPDSVREVFEVAFPDSFGPPTKMKIQQITIQNEHRFGEDKKEYFIVGVKLPLDKEAIKKIAAEQHEEDRDDDGNYNDDEDPEHKTPMELSEVDVQTISKKDLTESIGNWDTFASGEYDNSPPYDWDLMVNEFMRELELRVSGECRANTDDPFGLSDICQHGSEYGLVITPVTMRQWLSAYRTMIDRVLSRTWKPLH